MIQLDGLRILRAELGLTQSELAAALNVSFTAINRWENDKARPNLSSYTYLLKYAKENGVSQSCIDEIKNSFELSRVRRNNAQVSPSGFKPFDRELLCQLAEEAETAIYVTDAQTDELLYVNRALASIIGKKRDNIQGQKCYQYIAGLDRPCIACRNNVLTNDKFVETTFEARSGNLYTARSKTIQWNGRTAHVRYITRLRGDSILQHVACGIGLYNINADYTADICYANDGYYDMYEGTKDMVDSEYKKNHTFGVCEEYRDSIKEFFKNVAKQHKNDKITFRARSCKGNIKWIKACAEYIDGKTVIRDKIMFTFFDVTHDVSNEMTLRSLIGQAPVATIVFEVCDKLLILRYISDNCIKINGYTAEETYARNKDGKGSDAHPDAQKYFVEHEWDDIITKKNISYTYSIKCKDGEYRYVNLSLSPVETDGKLLYYGTLRTVDYEGPEVMLVNN